MHNGGLAFRSVNVEQPLPPGLPADLAGRKVVFGVRAEHVVLGTTGTRGQVDMLQPLGDSTLAFFNFGGDSALVASVEPSTRLEPGENVGFSIDVERSHLFDAADGRRLN